MTGLQTPSNAVISGKPGLKTTFCCPDLIQLFNQKNGDATITGLRHFCGFKLEAGCE